MKSKFLLIGSILISFGISCIPEGNYGPYPGERKSPVSMEHTYELQVVDINDTPLPEVKVDFYIKKVNFYIEELEVGMIRPQQIRQSEELYEDKKILKSSITYTDFEGKVLEKVLLEKSTRQFASSSYYRTCFRYELTKKGYFPESGVMVSSSVREIESEKVTLIRPTDYFKPTFLSSKIGMELKDKILTLLKKRSLGKSKVLETPDCYMQTRSIELIEFKDKNYLKVGFVSTNVYNSLKLTKYDVGKSLFDEVIRKILTPLNSYISDPNQFYGYDLHITGFTRPFTREYGSIPIKYRFIIPQETVKRYEDKDISGQGLLNESIILMNDERIELKLQ